MLFMRALNEATPGGLKYSIDIKLEVAKVGKTNNGNDSFQAIYKWINASFRNEQDEAFLKLKKLEAKGANGPVKLGDMQQIITNDLKSVGLEKYIAPSNDSSWSNMKQVIAQAVKNYPTKTRAFSAVNGEDIIIHMRYEQTDNGTGAFKPNGDNGPGGIINHKEQEAFPKKV